MTTPSQWEPNFKEKIYVGTTSLMISVCGIGYGLSHALDIPTEVSEGLVLILSPSVLSSLTFAYMAKNINYSLHKEFNAKGQTSSLGTLQAAVEGGTIGLFGTGIAYSAGYALGHIFKLY